MDNQRFDDLTKSLAGAGSRRRILKGFAAAAVGAVASAIGLAEADAAPRLKANAKCGGKGACPAGTRCVGRPKRCRCVAGTELVGGRCVKKCPGNRMRDANGMCGCLPGTEMVGGACVKTCPGNKMRDADGMCVCKTGCAGGKVPGASCACVCPAGKQDKCMVNGVDTCVDFETDPNNCGGCGAADPERFVCAGPTTTCRTTTKNNGDRDTRCACPNANENVCVVNNVETCIDILSDPNNCGGCGSEDPAFVCGDGVTCTDGHCADAVE